MLLLLGALCSAPVWAAPDTTSERVHFDDVPVFDVGLGVTERRTLTLVNDQDGGVFIDAIQLLGDPGFRLVGGLPTFIAAGERVALEVEAEGNGRRYQATGLTVRTPEGTSTTTLVTATWPGASTAAAANGAPAPADSKAAAGDAAPPADPAPPPAPTSAPPASGRGALPKAHIDRVVKSTIPRLRLCYNRELRSNPSFGGSVKFRFVIDPNGAVVSTTVRSTTFPSGIAEACMLTVLRSMEFDPPSGNGHVIVTYPLVFSPG